MIVATSSPIKWKVGAQLIKWYQNTQFSHVLIIKDDLVFQASHGYVNCQYIEVFLEENKIIDLYEVSDDIIDFEFVKRQLGKKYGYLEIINIATKYLFSIQLFKEDKNERFICSEFVGKALKLNWVNDFTTPKEIDTYLEGIYGNR